MDCGPPFIGTTCQWPVDTSCFDEEWEALDESTRDRALDLASATLRRLTGYRVGGCLTTLRPCKPSCCGGSMFPSYYGSGTFQPQMNAMGFWVNSCGCTSGCSCTELCEIVLPGPVGYVESVWIDGAVISPMNYRVDGTRLLWVGEGDCPFPACQDMTREQTEPDTFSVNYLNAYPVDSSGAYAAAVLAMEFARACGGGKCRLPSGVTSIVRQGVSMQIAAGAFPGGATGIREVDAFVALWNPEGLRQACQVWSPDQRRPRVVG